MIYELCLNPQKCKGNHGKWKIRGKGNGRKVRVGVGLLGRVRDGEGGG